MYSISKSTFGRCFRFDNLLIEFNLFIFSLAAVGRGGSGARDESRPRHFTSAKAGRRR